MKKITYPWDLRPIFLQREEETPEDLVDYYPFLSKYFYLKPEP